MLSVRTYQSSFCKSLSGHSLVQSHHKAYIIIREPWNINWHSPDIKRLSNLSKHYPNCIKCIVHIAGADLSVSEETIINESSWCCKVKHASRQIQRHATDYSATDFITQKQKLLFSRTGERGNSRFSMTVRAYIRCRLDMMFSPSCVCYLDVRELQTLWVSQTESGSSRFLVWSFRRSIHQLGAPPSAC